MEVVAEEEVVVEVEMEVVKVEEMEAVASSRRKSRRCRDVKY